MRVRVERAHRFRRYDRIVINGAHYRPVGKIGETHEFQLVVDDVVEEMTILKTDREINMLTRRGAFRCDVNHYSRVMAKLRATNDSTDLDSLDDKKLSTIAWKREWCVRFIRAASDPKRKWRPRWTLTDMRRFIAAELPAMEAWYLEEFGERRPPGRRRAGQPRKCCDYPGGSTLRDWLFAYREKGFRLEAFVDRYDRCGNRNQLDPELAEIVGMGVQHWLSRRQPAVSDVKTFVEVKLERLRQERDLPVAPSVSEKAIRKRLNEVDVFRRDAARIGPDAAIRRHAPVGRGLLVRNLLERVEMDDWEFDLMAVLEDTAVWRSMSAKQRKIVRRVRCTVTAAIDLASRCIVGFNITPSAPCTPATKSALRSIFVDKTGYALSAGAESPWDMYGPPGSVVTDGGPAFKGDFSFSQKQLVGRLEPSQDPRMRGTIESFFRTFKRLCRMYVGRTFSNVVEKGDYNPEAMAALTFDELQAAAVRFVVDDYHNRPHRGLEGRTPANTWNHLMKSRGGLDPLPSRAKLIQAFGMRGKARLQKDGITYLHGRYGSQPLARLQCMIGNVDLPLVVDPDDLSQILVAIPPRLRHRDDIVNERTEFAQRDGDYLIVPSVDDRPPGTTLADVVYASAELRKFVREENEAGRLIRLRLYEGSMLRAEQARIAAGVPQHELTQDAYERLVAQIERSAKFAFHVPDKIPASTTAKPIAERGRKISRNANATDHQSATAPGTTSTESSRPFGGSVNMYGMEDDD